MRESWKEEIEEAKKGIKQKWENVTLKQLAVLIVAVLYLIVVCILGVYMIGKLKKDESKTLFPTKIESPVKQTKDCW